MDVVWLRCDVVTRDDGLAITEGGRRVHCWNARQRGIVVQRLVRPEATRTVCAEQEAREQRLRSAKFETRRSDEK